MSTGYGYSHPRLCGADLRCLATTLCGKPAYCYSQALDRLGLKSLETQDLTLAPEGRAFGPQAEVRWQRCEDNPDAYAVLVLSDSTQDMGEDWQVQTFEAGECLTLYLLGVWQTREQAWIEVRIPHPLAYPIPGPEHMARPTAQAIEYGGAQDGVVRYIRLVGLGTERVEDT